MSGATKEARLRNVSRIALYGSLVLAAVLAGLLLHLASDPLTEEQTVTWHLTDFQSLPEVQLLREYVQIDTSLATGSAVAGARFLGRQLESAGIPFHLEPVGETDANLWAILEGEDPRAVVLHHHIDVEDVPDAEEWRHPPFAAAFDLPWLYGLGTYDMKSVGIAQLLAMVELARSGAPLKRSVILLATTGEETGSHLGTRWILREHPELVARFDVVLTEGGVLEGLTLDDIKYWGTEFAQKRYWDLVACSPDRQRLELLREDLLVYGRPLEGELVVPEEVRAFLPAYAATRDRPLYRWALEDPRRILRDRALFHRLPPYLQAMFRNELHPFDVQEDAGGGWRLPIKVHLLPGVDFDAVREELLPAWLFHGVETVLDSEPAADHGSPLTHPVMDAIEGTLRRHDRSAPVGPMFLPWTATDSRFFRAQGIPSYGFTPFKVLTSDALRVGGAGERIALPAYVEGIAIYRELLRRLVT